jgi:dTDP-4-amino-4,6-dideoxygalactose transaminase
MIKFIDLYQQYLPIQAEIDRAIQAVICDGVFIGGKQVSEFENNFAEYQQAAYCIGVGNGTDALEIAIEALDLPKGSEIIVPGNSFIASAEAVTRTGHRVVFCDANCDDYTLNIENAKSRITDKTAAIMAVHLYGHPCNMDELMAMAQAYQLKIVEDCAQAHGAEYRNKRVGTIGDIGTFSFYPTKNLGAYGDGGAIITNDAELARKCLMISNHGQVKKYHHQFEGRNSKLDALQAAILNVKLKYLDLWINRRIEIADFYLEQLKGIENLVLPVRQLWVKQVYHLFVVRCAMRDHLKTELEQAGIQTGIHYPIALPKLPAYRYCKQAEESMFVNQADEILLSLPMGEHLTVIDTYKIVRVLQRFFENKKMVYDR